MYTDYMQPLFCCSLTLLASSFFSESVVVVFHFPFLFHHAFFHLLSLAYWPFCTRLLASLIRAAILYFSCRLHCLHPDALIVIGSPVISVLLYQSAAFVFLNGSQVSEGLV